MSLQVLIDIPDNATYGVTAARAAYNAQLPATVKDGENNDVPNPDLLASDAAYVKFIMSHAVASWCRQFAAQAPQPEIPPVIVDGEVMSVTRKQGLKALLRAGEPEIDLSGPILESQILATINAMPEDTSQQVQQKYDTLYEFQNAKTWGFNNPFTVLLQTMLGMNNAQKRALFNLAATFTD